MDTYRRVSNRRYRFKWILFDYRDVAMKDQENELQWLSYSSALINA